MPLHGKDGAGDSLAGGPARFPRTGSLPQDAFPGPARFPRGPARLPVSKGQKPFRNCLITLSVTFATTSRLHVRARSGFEKARIQHFLSTFSQKDLEWVPWTTKLDFGLIPIPRGCGPR